MQRKKQVNEQVKETYPKVAYEVVNNELDNVIVDSQNTLTSMISSIEARSHYSRKCWARATTEHHVKIGDVPDPVMALKLSLPLSMSAYLERIALYVECANGK